MKKRLLILLCLPLLFSSCVNDSQKNKIEDSITDTLFSFNVTSKNSELTSKSGKDVSLNEMTTINVKSGDKILFKAFNFTLDNKVDEALNFYLDNGTLMCNAPTNLSIMSMPPNGDGLNTFNAGENFEISGMTLIKVNSINFVISDFKKID
jgi:hypothetical protein|tara:strand:+ start:234 stop:686 length:453 start_codon:yes stop_codon:yes gene_type:complete